MMNKTKQRIAIAEACGWRWKNNGMDYFYLVSASEGAHLSLPERGRLCEDALESVPDYLNDLNAMHEVEKELGARWGEYQIELEIVVLGKLSAHDPMREKLLIHATAAQRAEAFLKTLNLWTEDDTD